jgi:hypothetical protein
VKQKILPVLIFLLISVFLLSAFPLKAQEVSDVSYLKTFEESKDVYLRIPTLSLSSFTASSVTTEEKSGSFQFNITLANMPKSNVITIPLETSGLEFYKQLPLTLELNAKDYDFLNATHAFKKGVISAYRPENVVNSYAVYKSKVSSGGTGKLYHIYRPQLFDAKGASSWADLTVTKNSLSIICDADFLAKAVYPVIVDPTFGYTSIGESYGGDSNWAHVCKATLSEAGTVTSISFYADSGSGTVGLAIYDDDGADGKPGTRLWVCSEEQSQNYDWVTVAVPDLELSAGDYWLGWCQTSVYWRWDSSEHYVVVGTLLSDPFGTPAGEHDNRVASIFANYTVGGGTFNLNLRTVDQAGNPLQNTTVHMNNGTAYSQATAGGWANWTGIAGSVQINASWLSSLTVNSTFTIDVSADTTLDVICNAWNFTLSGATRHIAADRDVLTASWAGNEYTFTFDSATASKTVVAESGQQPVYVLGAAYDLATAWNSTAGTLTTQVQNTTYTYAVGFPSWGDFYVRSVQDPILSLGWSDKSLLGTVNGSGTMTIYCGTRQAPETVQGATASYDAATKILTVQYTAEQFRLDWALSPGDPGDEGDEETPATDFTVASANFGSSIRNQTRTVTFTFTFTSSSITVTNVTFQGAGAEMLLLKTALPTTFTRSDATTGSGTLEAELTVPADADLGSYTVQVQVTVLDPFGVAQIATAAFSWVVAEDAGGFTLPEEIQPYLLAGAVALVIAIACVALLVRRKR